jgi:hypothetical protein
MRRRDRLTRRERREFDGLVQTFFEREAPDPQAPPSTAFTPELPALDPRDDDGRHRHGPGDPG